MTEWYYSQGEQPFGPVSQQQLRSLAAAGTVVPTDRVWKAGMADWVDAERVRGLFSPQTGLEDGRIGFQPPLVPPPLSLGDAAADREPASKNNPTASNAALGLEDGLPLNLGEAVKTTVQEFRQLDYSFLMPFKKLLSRSLINKKAVRWILCFGLFPLLLMRLKQTFGWKFEQSVWLIGGYFCLFWAAYFHGILKPAGAVWSRGVRWGLFTVASGIPLLFTVQQFPVFHSLYQGAESETFLYRLLGLVLGIGLLEETCKALPLLIFGLRKEERMPLKTGIFLGMMSGFGFALAEVVKYSVLYWNRSATASTLIVTQAIEKAATSGSYLTEKRLLEELTLAIPQMAEFYGNTLLTQITRFMSLPLLHACWAGIVGWFIAIASQRRGNPWPTIAVGILFVATMHGLYDLFAQNYLGVGIAALTILVFMGYLLHGQDQEVCEPTPAAVNQK